MSDDEGESDVNFYSFVLINEESPTQQSNKEPLQENINSSNNKVNNMGNTSLVLKDLKSDEQDGNMFFLELSQAFYSKDKPSKQSQDPSSLKQIESQSSLNPQSKNQLFENKSLHAPSGYLNSRKSEEMRDSKLNSSLKSYQIKRVPKAQVIAIHPELQSSQPKSQFSNQNLCSNSIQQQQGSNSVQQQQYPQQQPNDFAHQPITSESSSTEITRKVFLKPKLFQDESQRNNKERKFKVNKVQEVKEQNFIFQQNDLNNSVEQAISKLDIAEHINSSQEEVEVNQGNQFIYINNQISKSNKNNNAKQSTAAPSEVNQDSQVHSLLLSGFNTSGQTGTSSSGSVAAFSRKTIQGFGSPESQLDTPSKNNQAQIVGSRSSYFAKINTEIKQPPITKKPSKINKRLVLAEVFDRFHQENEPKEKEEEEQSKEVLNNQNEIKIKEDTKEIQKFVSKGGYLQQQRNSLEKKEQKVDNFFAERQIYGETNLYGQKELLKDKLLQPASKISKDSSAIIKEKKLLKSSQEIDNPQFLSNNQGNLGNATNTSTDLHQQFYAPSMKKQIASNFIYKCDPQSQGISQRSNLLKKEEHSHNQLESRILSEDSSKRIILPSRIKFGPQTSTEESMILKNSSSTQFNKKVEKQIGISPRTPFNSNSGRNSQKFHLQPQSSLNQSQQQQEKIMNQLHTSSQFQSQQSQQQQSSLLYLPQQTLPSHSLQQSSLTSSIQQQQQPTHFLSQQGQSSSVMTPSQGMFAKQIKTITADQSNKKFHVNPAIQNSCQSNKQLKTAKESVLFSQTQRKGQTTGEDQDEEEKQDTSGSQAKRSSFLTNAFKQQDNQSGQNLNLSKYAIKNGLIRMPIGNNSHYQNNNNNSAVNASGNINRLKINTGAEMINSFQNQTNSSCRNLPTPQTFSVNQLITPLSSRNGQQQQQFGLKFQGDNTYFPQDGMYDKEQQILRSFQSKTKVNNND